jgi:type VI secretion system protein ImpG
MDELLPYYNRELAYIRNLGAEFADKHPKIAARLRLSKKGGEDPHVSRLVEGFAFLTARVRRKIDDEFPEITKSLLGTLYPHLLAPFPSCTIARFTPDEALAQSPDAPTVGRGTGVESAPIDGQPCRFRTCYPVTLWPIRVAAAGVHGSPLPAPNTKFTRGATAVVKIQLETISPKVRFADLPLEALRFFLYGQPLHAYELYERLLNNALGVVVAAPGHEAAHQALDRTSLAPVGFARDEGLIDYSARSFLGYRLLAEYFAFPEKFLFVDFTGLSRPLLQSVGAGNRLDVYVFLNEASQDLERNIDRESFQLGCTPLVNLFAVRAEPIPLKQNVYEYRVAPDARRPMSHEVFSIDRVVATSPADEELTFTPLYAPQHGDSADDRRAFWHMSRRPSTATGDDVDHGTEVFLSLADLDAAPMELDQWVLDVKTTCTNRDLPGRLPFGGGQPHLQIASGGAMAKVACLVPPTKTLRPALDDAVLWRLVSMLSLNHLSLVDGGDGADAREAGAALREVLALHDWIGTTHSRTVVEGLAGVTYRRVTGRAGGAAAGGFCRGVEATLQLDEAKFTGGGLYLFASILDRFLGLYATMNSFTRTRIVTNRREEPLCIWPPRAGEQALA